MAIPTPDQAAARWAQNRVQLDRPHPAGIQAVQTAPGQAAARQKSLYVQKVQSSQDKWARNVATVSLDEWQQAAINKGLPRDRDRRPGGPAQDAGLHADVPPARRQRAGVPAGPRGTIDQNIDRMVKNVRGMAAFKR